MREISKDMLAEIEWIHRQIKTMGKGFDKRITADYLGRSLEFIYGVMYERQRQLDVENERNQRFLEKSSNIK